MAHNSSEQTTVKGPIWRQASRWEGKVRESQVGREHRV